MNVTIKPKRFGPVVVRYDGEGGVDFAASLEGAGEQYPPHDKPVSTLMASVGHCLVESLRMVARKAEVDLPPFAISVVSEKAIDAPSRLQSMQCLLHGNLPAAADGQPGLLAQAKAICTVSNTLACELTVDQASA